MLDLARTEGGSKHSQKSLRHAFRIARTLEDLPRRDLHDDEAPWRVVRWVAYGKTATERRQRADLALHLRRTLDTPNGGWHVDSALAAAWLTWQAGIEDARHHGLAQPRCQDIPASEYARAIAAAAEPQSRSKRRRPRGRSLPDTPPELSDEERAALAQALPALVGVLPTLQRLLKPIG